MMINVVVMSLSADEFYRGYDTTSSCVRSKISMQLSSEFGSALGNKSCCVENAHSYLHESRIVCGWTEDTPEIRTPLLCGPCTVYAKTYECCSHCTPGGHISRFIICIPCWNGQISANMHTASLILPQGIIIGVKFPHTNSYWLTIALTIDIECIYKIQLLDSHAWLMIETPSFHPCSREPMNTTSPKNLILFCAQNTFATLKVAVPVSPQPRMMVQQSIPLHVYLDTRCFTAQFHISLMRTQLPITQVSHSTY